MLRGEWPAQHRIPVASGGTDDLSNCEALCNTCHRKARALRR